MVCLCHWAMVRKCVDSVDDVDAQTDFSVSRYDKASTLSTGSTGSTGYGIAYRLLQNGSLRSAPSAHSTQYFPFSFLTSPSRDSR